MEQRVLDEEEEELYGIRRKKILVKGTDGAEDAADGEGVREEDLTAELDDEYVYEGYPVIEGGPDYGPDAEGEDDESLVMLSPEEAERLIREREEKARREEGETAQCLSEGNAALERRDFDRAKQLFDRANELRPDNLDVNVGYMRAYARDFESLDDFAAVDKAYGLCYDSAGEAFAGRIKELFGERLSALRGEIAAKKTAEETVYRAEQEKRRAALKERADGESGRLIKVMTPFFIALLVAVVCGCLVNAIEGSVLLIVALVAGAVAVLLLVPTALFGRKLINTRRLQRENEREESTEEGRRLIALQDKLDFIDDCLE